MGMFDWYRPAGALTCPACGASLRNWQGKDVDRALFVWAEGIAAPIAHDVPDECRMPPDELAEVRLPERFTIYTYDCPRHQPIDAECTTEGGVWTRTTVVFPSRRR